MALGPLDIQQAMAEIDSDFADTTADEARETTGMETDAVVHFALPARIPVYGDPCLLALEWVTLGSHAAGSLRRAHGPREWGRIE